jgi:hypothetical protein
MKTSSNVPHEFLEKHDLEDGWEIRFTADEYRAREIAQQYREMGQDVELVPLSPGEETPEMDELKGFGEELDLDHDPIQYVEQDECAPCLDETYALFTKADGRGVDGSETAVDESLYD